MKADELFQSQVLRELRGLRKDVRGTLKLARELVAELREELTLYKRETDRRLSDLEARK